MGKDGDEWDKGGPRGLCCSPRLVVLRSCSLRAPIFTLGETETEGFLLTGFAGFLSLG